MNWTLTTLADCLGDYVVYRNLEPAEPTLSGLRSIWPQLGFKSYVVPRKGSPEHAAYLGYLLAEAGTKRGSGSPRRLLVIGDTLSGDGAVASQLNQQLPTWAFIGHEQPAKPAGVEIKGAIALSTRWAGLADFTSMLQDQDFTWNEQAALLLDLDKSLIGARGRNDHVIDEARVAAVRSTLCGSLADCYQEDTFRRIYNKLNQSAFHFITADNQDYVAYMCLMIIAGIIPEDKLWLALENKSMASIEAFVTRCGQEQERMSQALLLIHREVQTGLANGDPTPFKEFRRAEFLETTGRMNCLPNDAEAAEVLNQEIVVTAEVFSLAKYAAARGALVFGISDKPDEASTPTPALAARGYLPIHRTVMKLHGTTLY
ncbi:MAG: hypothetical protein ACYC6L_06325 [Anaerolineae bacterium]